MTLCFEVCSTSDTLDSTMPTFDQQELPEAPTTYQQNLQSPPAHDDDKGEDEDEETEPNRLTELFEKGFRGRQELERFTRFPKDDNSFHIQCAKAINTLGQWAGSGGRARPNLHRLLVFTIVFLF